MSEKFEFIDKGVCAPKKFKSAGLSAGIKRSGKLDLALIYSEVPAVSAGVFTQNKLQAAPLIVTQRHLQQNNLQAIIINSGNANSCTGNNGMIAAENIAQQTAKQLNLITEQVATASTGIIGEPLPTEKILDVLPQLIQKLSPHDKNAAHAILTTDTFIKQTAIQLTLTTRHHITLGAIAKGSGMIHPNMATMLCFITSDAAIEQAVLQQALSLAVAQSFNMVSVDGDTSTNDMVLIMANQQAKNPVIHDLNSPDGQLFYQALVALCIKLAKLIAMDGEGATKLLTVEVNHAQELAQARQIAKSIVSSSLVKTALFGNDPNWGRIACAIGYSGGEVILEQLSIYIDTVALVTQGKPVHYATSQMLHLLEQPEILIKVDLNLGHHNATAWGCNLSYHYIKINSDSLT